MMVLVTYDVSTIHETGARRLRRVANVCKDFGQRVQNSVFECWIDPAQLVQLRKLLLEEVDLEADSIRFYFLGSNWKRRVEHLGVKTAYDPEGPLIL